MNSSHRASAPLWGWRDVPRDPGPVVIVDVDGVIADARHRQHYLDNDGWRDWDAFLAAAAHDRVITEEVDRLHNFDDDHTIALVTARPAWVGAITVNWLEQNAIPWHLLVMRSNHDYRKAHNMKLESVSLLEALGFTPVLAIDDNRHNIAAYERIGLDTRYVDSGYHDD